MNHTPTEARTATYNGAHAAYTAPAGHDASALFPAVPSGPMAALPEAACSVNLFFEVAAGYGKAQATGRGATAQEAVDNLKATIEATRAALAPPVSVTLSREAQIAQLLSCGIAKAVSRGDFQRVERLAKASALILSGAVEACAVEGTYTVQSRTQEGVSYQVSATGACACKDYAHHVTAEQPYYCLHTLAVLMEIRLAETLAAF